MRSNTELWGAHLWNLRVWGSNYELLQELLRQEWVFLTCKLQLGDETYQQQFIVCRQLAPGIILGRDFLSRNQLGINVGTRRNITVKR